MIASCVACHTPYLSAFFSTARRHTTHPSANHQCSPSLCPHSKRTRAHTPSQCHRAGSYQAVNGEPNLLLTAPRSVSLRVTLPWYHHSRRRTPSGKQGSYIRSVDRPKKLTPLSARPTSLMPMYVSARYRFSQMRASLFLRVLCSWCRPMIDWVRAPMV